MLTLRLLDRLLGHLTISVFVFPELGVLVITILQGKDMVAMDSNGKLTWSYVFRRI